jgi:hypothetical protein
MTVCLRLDVLKLDLSKSEPKVPRLPQRISDGFAYSTAREGRRVVKTVRSHAVMDCENKKLIS